LQHLNITDASSGYKPNLQIFAGYNWLNQQFSGAGTTPGLDQYLDGWNAGAQVTWNIFDGLLTHGKVVQAKALYQKSKTSVDEKARQVELEVRTTYSDFIGAQEVLESQKTVQAEAEESLREAYARASAAPARSSMCWMPRPPSRRRVARRCRRCMITTPPARGSNTPSARTPPRSRM